MSLLPKSLRNGNVRRVFGRRRRTYKKGNSMRRIWPIVLILASTLSTAVAQTANGNNNGNGDRGIGVGNGNGNGNANGNNNGNGNSSSASISNGNSRNTPSVFAPGLAAAGIESCLGSASAGGSVAGFGITFGSTMVDRGCQIRLYARTLYALGHRRAATQMLCNDPEVMQALAYEGVSCQDASYDQPDPAPRRNLHAGAK